MFNQKPIQPPNEVIKMSSSKGSFMFSQLDPNASFRYSSISADDVGQILVVNQRDDALVTVKKYRMARYACSLNKYMLLFIVTLYAAFVGTHYFNWTRWESILIYNKAFSDLCSPNEDSCSKQVIAISSLLPLISLLQFTFTFIAGLLLDIVGPKFCSVFGVCCLIVGWLPICFGGSSSFYYRLSFAIMGAGWDPAFFGTMNIANIFTGYSSTVISLFGAARGLSNFFPFLADILTKSIIWFDIRTIAIIFIVLYAMCLIIALICIPSKPYIIATLSPITSPSNIRDRQSSFVTTLSSDHGNPSLNPIPRSGTKTIIISEENIRHEPIGASGIASEIVDLTGVPISIGTAVESQTTGSMSSFSMVQPFPASQQPRGSSSIQLEAPTNAPNISQSRMSSSSFLPDVDKYSIYSNFPVKQSVSRQLTTVAVQVDEPRTSPLQWISLRSRKKKSKDPAKPLPANEEQQTDVQIFFDDNFIRSPSLVPHDIPIAPKTSNDKFLNKIKHQLIRLWVCCSSLKFFLVAFITMTNITRNNYYLATATRQLGPAEPFLAILNILSFIPGPICGYFVDRYGPLSVLAGINTCNTLSFISLSMSEVIPSIKTVCQYIAVIAAYPGIGYLLSQMYTYIAISFPAEDMGKLAGFSSLLGGLAGYILVPYMSSYAATHDTHLLMNIVSIGLSVGSFVCLGKLYLDSRVKVSPLTLS